MNSSSILAKGCGVCMAPGDSVNHLDHIAPIAEIMQIPMLISQIANAGNTTFSVVIKNNTGVVLSLNSISTYVPVTYLYGGFQTS